MMMMRTSSASASALTLALLLVCTFSPCLSQTDNTVNETTGAILWGELAPDKPYKTVGYEADDGGLDPYYALATSYIETSLPELLPVDTVKGILEGDKTIGDEWQNLTTSFVGFALSVIIGFLFILIFPIVGLCFCCCRCCGNCGGKRIHDEKDRSSCKRIVFSVVLAILALFVIAGAACCFVSSDQVSKNLGGLNSSFSDAIDDFNTFVDNTNNQFTRLGDTNFRFMSNEVKNYVGNASSEVSERMIKNINDNVGLDGDLNQLSALSATALVKVQELEAQTATLEAQKTSAISQLNTADAACSNCLTSEIIALNAIDLTDLKTKLADFKTKVATDVFGEMRDTIATQIKTEVDKGTNGIDVGTTMDDIYNDQLKGLLDQMVTLKDSLRSDSSKYQNQVGDFVDIIQPYDKYRWYAGMGLAIFLTLIGLMLLLGVVLGLLCGSASVKPTERGAMSNCGGICLMASVGLIFIFGAFLMLLTTLMYIFGSLTERYGCQSLENFDRIETYTSDIDLGIGYDLKNLTFNVNGETLRTSLSGLMDDCKAGKTLYTAMNMEGVVNTAVQKISDFKNDLNISSKIDPSLIASSVGSTSLDSAAEIAALQGTVAAIDAVETELNRLKTELDTLRTQVNTIQAGLGDTTISPMITTVTAMITTTGELKTTANTINTVAGALPTKISDATTRLQDATVMTPIITATTQNFVDTMFGFLDSYTQDIVTKLANDVGKCTPVYSITNAIFAEAFCHGIVDPLNGFWLALGWCLFFFMPSLILAVKLAKYFRTMLYDDGYDSTDMDAGTKPYYTEPSAPPANHIMPNNKVAPF